jgi:hypothetical protein
MAPTIDHVRPVTRGGLDIAEKWVSASMLRNGAKANFTLEELHWTLHTPGDVGQWDGLRFGFSIMSSAIDPSLSVTDTCAPSRRRPARLCTHPGARHRNRTRVDRAALVVLTGKVARIRSEASVATEGLHLRSQRARMIFLHAVRVWPCIASSSYSGGTGLSR